jgi:uncharacterized protein with PQ loop repeat
MRWFLIIVGSLLELAALIAVIRLWRQKYRSWVGKLLWSMILNIPFFGLLIYGFLTLNPESQSERLSDDGGGTTGGVF